jgi:hypothetical protein
MLARGIIAQTTHVPLCTHAGLFEGGEQAQVLKLGPIPAFAFVFPPKNSSVVVVGFQCSGSYLQEQKVLLWIMQHVTNSNLFSLWQNLYDSPWKNCRIFWWFKNVIYVGEMNVCPHNTELPECANISSRYIGLGSPKHLKCMHSESVVRTELVSFSCVNSCPSLLYKSEEAKGAQSLDHIASPTPCMCELIQVSTRAKLP